MIRTERSRSVLLTLTAIVAGLMGLALTGGGLWLGFLGGTWFYLAAGGALLLCAVLLAWGRSLAWWVQAVLLLGTLAWSLWEVGLDWWGIAIRGDVPFLFGLLLMLPAYARRLDEDPGVAGAPAGGGGTRADSAPRAAVPVRRGSTSRMTS